MKPLITNIQRFCVHDGPGIRTTVFFKGCTLHCPWCSNPENIDSKKQLFYIKEKCSNNCKNANRCNAFLHGVPRERDMQLCNYGAVGEFGKFYSKEQLYCELIKDKKFFGKDGGITFSGGEALLFLEAYDEVIEKLHVKEISVAVETSLMVPTSYVEWAITRIDYFYVDIKIINSSICNQLLGGNICLFEKNIRLLSERIETNKIIYRMPVVQDITDTKENITAIKEFLLTYPADHIEIFSVHNLGEKKYQRIGKPYKKWNIVNEERLLEICDQFEQIGVRCEICSL